MAPDTDPAQAYAQRPLGTGAKVKLDWTNGSRSVLKRRRAQLPPVFSGRSDNSCDGEGRVQALAVKSNDLSSIPAGCL